MERPSYLEKYLFDWELMDVILDGHSALDSKFFMGPLYTDSEVNSFLKGYGLDPSDPISKAELFGNFQEAVQFIKRYFLKEGTEDGLDLQIPNSLFMITDVSQLFLMATNGSEKYDVEERLWAEIILKVMHTILHVDKDLRSNYFQTIQTQIFDRFYKYVFRDEDNKLFLGHKGTDDKIPLIDFETKSKKSRDSVIIKLLHKAENVAEELFDRIGIRFITEDRFDSIRTIKFLLENHIVIPHNIKPSRSVNTIFDLQKFKVKHKNVIRMALRNNLSEDRFLNAMERELLECLPEAILEDGRNKHTSGSYQSIQFTCRSLIKYKNPFLQEFTEVRKFAKEHEENELSKKVLSLDMSLIARDIRFFYPYEVQILDIESHKENTEGEASHQEYKKSQVKSAMKRVFSGMLQYKGINLD